MAPNRTADSPGLDGKPVLLVVRNGNEPVLIEPSSTNAPIRRHHQARRDGETTMDETGVTHPSSIPGRPRACTSAAGLSPSTSIFTADFP